VNHSDSVTIHPLLDRWLAAARGQFPPVDGRVLVVPALGAGLEASVGFTGHALIATALPELDVLRRNPDGFGGSLQPDFLRWLAGPSGWISDIDVTLVATGRGNGSLQRRQDLDAHPRVRRALSLRSEVSVYGDERGLVTLARGIAGRRELSIEASEGGQGRGWGRSLLSDALALVPVGECVFAGVSPGNARSLRAFLGVGFRPLGSEVLFRPARETS
jgi:hypothetical protein